MGKIIKYNDYDLNEGVRDLMTPKNPRDAVNNILKDPQGWRFSNSVNALEVIKEGGLFEIMTEEDYLKIAEWAKGDIELHIKDPSSGQKNNIVWFMNKYGSGKWFINIDTGRASEIDGPGAGWAAKMLKEIL